MLRAVCLVCSLVIAALASAPSARADTARPKLLVLPLAAIARRFDARLLVALADTRRVQTITHDEDPECTTLRCLATFGAEAGAAYVLALSVLREGDALTVFGAVIDVKSATAWRRIELPRVHPASLATHAPAELVPQILGAPPGGYVLGFARPRHAVGVAAMYRLAAQLATLRAFEIAPLEGGDHARSATARRS